MKDKVIAALLKKEEKRQASVINLIASENEVSVDVREALGSVFTNKYAEGYPGKRYYKGNEISDALEQCAQERALALFGLDPKEWSVNVQPLSGSPANLAVLSALVPHQGKILAMDLASGGHLTHGHRASFTGKWWKQIPYTVDKKTEQLDFKAIQSLAEKENPDLVICGYTAYPRIVDFKKMRKSIGKRILLVDMSHIAGLVAGGVHPSPFAYADVVTTTVHKTLRGPRSGIIFSRKSFSAQIDSAVFPGLQGGPHLNQIAAVAVALQEACTGAFKRYAQQIIRNAQALAKTLTEDGWTLVSGGTDTHMIIINTWERGISGKEASELLEREGIIVNMNMIPFDTRSPFAPSGIRIGVAAETTKGKKEKDMRMIGKRITAILVSSKNNSKTE